MSRWQGPKRPPREKSEEKGPRAEPPGFRARLVAARAHRRVMRERRPIDEAIALETKTAPLPPADLGLVRAILTVAFRRRGTIRQALASRAATGEIAEAGPLQPLLETALAQILFMDVPDHAAVDCAVEIAKRDSEAKHYAAFANALLRRIAAEKAQILANMPDTVDAPEWLFERWSRAYGAERAEAIARIHRQEPPVDLTIFAPLSPEIAGRMLSTGSFRLETEAAIAALPGYAEGRFQVQDAAAALPARLMGAKAGMRIADLCAAPGGKTAQLAATGAAVLAVERSARRAERLRENLARLKLPAEVMVGDALTLEAGLFDAILLDAPCSATGTIRRHPEVAWTKTLVDILALARQQRAMLESAARSLKPGGILVFATCSLEPEEGERQIEAFLSDHPQFMRRPVTVESDGVPAEMLTSAGDLRVLPCHLAKEGGADGFFAARLQHRA
ncbi:RsmB/NOP family class I SAM-dependent RNA methyltransferase [Rhabdaerophilum sp.]|uniref:RsmB/NOP family class I SAM-dependent RNA methyltransferase n=1 Tax=Rhabdaerophilum sp. TaxID=2717341 RepID=UPI0038D3A83B